MATTPDPSHGHWVDPTYRTPLHERVKALGAVRRVLRGGLFRFLRKLAATDDARAIQADSLRHLLPRRPALVPAAGPLPYADLGEAPPASGAAGRDDVIFITARFRSGSTALWNLFRHVPGATSYYEPLNERRWFDPKARGGRIDATHRGVAEYWREYDGLDELGRYFRPEWNDRDLYMDAQSWDPDLKRYVETLIDRAPGRPILQFNRIDFRLPWFRHHFPRAAMLHLYRHPRHQWCSALVDPKAVPRDVTVADFARHDHYYLLNWARDLKYYFPFLDSDPSAHPYRVFYLIWKLSYLFGRKYAHHSLAFENLTCEPEQTLSDLFGRLRVAAPVDQLAGLIEKPRAGRWAAYAPDDWFREQEAECEATIADFFPQPT